MTLVEESSFVVGINSKTLEGLHSIYRKSNKNEKYSGMGLSGFISKKINKIKISKQKKWYVSEYADEFLQNLLLCWAVQVGYIVHVAMHLNAPNKNEQVKMSVLTRGSGLN